jgi:hypothetical protein
LNGITCNIHYEGWLGYEEAGGSFPLLKMAWYELELKQSDRTNTPSIHHIVLKNP